MDNETIPRTHDAFNVKALEFASRAFGTEGTKKPDRLVRIVASQLRPGDLNVRFWASTPNRLKVEGFALSIWTNCVFDGGKLVKSGVLDPIKVFNDNTEALTVGDGESRWRAVRLLEGFDVLTGEPVQKGKGVLAGILANLPYETAQVPPDTIWFDAQIMPKMNAAQRRIFMGIANSGRDYTDLEHLDNINALLNGDPENGIPKMPQKVIAEQMGKTDTWVSHILKLNKVTAELRPYLVEGLIKPTTAIEAIEDCKDPEVATRMLLEQIEAKKGEAAIDFEEAMEEARAAQIEVDRLVADGTGKQIAPGSGGRLTKLAVAQRTVQTASTRAKKAKQRMQSGQRVTARSVREATAEKKTGETPAAVATGRFSRSNYDRLLEVVRFVAARSADATSRDMLNDALKRCGYDLVEPRVDDQGQELPVAGETSVSVAADNSDQEAAA